MNDHLPSITLVTPSFNQARFLEQTIDSVLSQGYPRLQYVVMDGGSTDGSVEIIRRYAKHLHHWRSGKDAGQGASILEGWRTGDGALIGWINSDDLLLRGSLHALARAWHPKRHLYYGDTIQIDAAGVVFHYAVIARPPDWVFKNGLMFTGQPGNFYSRSLAEAVGFFDPALRCAMECDVVTRLLQAGGRARMVRWPMAALRQYETTKTSTLAAVITREMREVYGRNVRGPLRDHTIREPLARLLIKATWLRYLNPLNAARILRKLRVRWSRPPVSEFLEPSGAHGRGSASPGEEP